MMGTLAPYEAAAAMLDAMATAGVIPCDFGDVASKLQAGNLVRFRCEGERKANGWARLFLDGVPAGTFGNWKAGVRLTWRAGGSDQSCRVDPAAIVARKAKERENEQRRHMVAGNAAAASWAVATPADADHPYLRRKRLLPCGLRQEGRLLLVPMLDITGRLWCLQRIAPDGGKRFFPGAKTAGLIWRCGFRKGEAVTDIVIGEGFATMAATHLATGLPVIAAMSAGNLGAVAVTVAKALPAATLILCADMDDGGNGGDGLAKATAAARAVNGRIARPPRPPGWPVNAAFDFNDLWTSPGGGDLICRALGTKG